MSRLRLLLAAVLVLLGLAASPALASPIAGVPSDASLLFTLDATGGTLKPGTDGMVTLRLRGAAADATWFTDRPDRAAGSIATGRLQAEWAGFGFDRIPPNAALVLQSAPSRRDTIALELRSIHYDARDHTVRFTARRLTRLDAGLSNLDAQLDRRIAQRFATATLFIDNANPGIRGGCALGQPQLMATTKAVYAMAPADGRLMGAAGNGGLYAIYGNTFGGAQGTSFGLPTLTAPVASTRWNVCTQGTFPSDRDLAPCQMGEVDLWITALPWMRESDEHWFPADGRTLDPDRYERYVGRFGRTLPKIDAPSPTSRWMVCVAPADTEDPGVGQLDLFAAAPEGLGQTWLAADGATVDTTRFPVLDAVLNGFSGDRKRFTLPDVPSPFPGLRYYVAASGYWVLDR